MKKLWKSVTGLEFSEKVLALLLLGLLVVAMLPVYRIGMYACPFYDDYSYNMSVKNFYNAYGAAGIIPGAKYTAHGMWWAWQGTYASIFMMALTPLFLGEQYYFLGIWLVITMIVVSAMVLGYTLAKNLLKANAWQSLICAIVLTLYMVEFIYTSFQGLFWYNSAVHYTFMHAVMFLMLAAAVKILYTRKLWSAIVLAVITMVLSIGSAGANFVTALQGLLFLIVIIAFGFVLRNKKTLFILLSVPVYGYGLYKNLIAPGNSVRAQYFEGYGAVKSILLSFKEAVIMLPKLTGISSVIVLLVMLPTIVAIVKKVNFKFNMPGLVLFFSFCLYATGFTSSFYGTGEAPLDRTMVSVKFTYQLLLVLNLFYFTGWLVRKYEKLALRQSLMYYAALAVLLVVCFAFSKDRAGGYLSYGSFYYTHTCYAQNFRLEYLDRIDKIVNSEEAVVGVRPITFRPWLLVGSNELSTDPLAEQNSFMAKYYNKEGIYIEIEDNNE